MESRRVYLPLTHDQVRELADRRRIAAPVHGWAAGTPGRVDARISPAAAQEDAEWLAFRAAAEHTVGYEAGARRVIASADAPAGTIREVSGAVSTTPSGSVPVVVAEDLPLRLVASLHVDDPDDDGAGAGADGEPALLWYDITEIDTVLGELDP